MDSPETPGPPPPTPPKAPATSGATMLLVVALAFLASFLIFRQVRQQVPSLRPADYSWKLTDLDGKPVDLSAFKGRPIFLNVWATWCPPCLEEIPSIARLAENPRLKNVAFLCVSIDRGIAAPKGFQERHGLPLTILHAAGPPPKVYESDAIPVTFLIAPDGRIVKREEGSMEWDGPETVKLLESLAGGS